MLPGEYKSQGAEQNWMCAHCKLSVTTHWPIGAGHAGYEGDPIKPDWLRGAPPNRS